MVRARDRSNNDQDLAHITSESLEVNLRDSVVCVNMAILT